MNTEHEEDGIPNPMEDQECESRPAKRKRTNVYDVLKLRPEEVGQRFTALCFSEPGDREESFYVTDEQGYFLHNRNRYYRCIQGKDWELEFKFIRELEPNEIEQMVALGGDLNVIHDKSETDKGLNIKVEEDNPQDGIGFI
jgi:hypothetical protein